MKVSYFSGLVVFLLSPGCAEAKADWRAMTRPERQAFIEAVAAECRLSDGVLQLRGEDELQLMPDPQASYESVDCALNKLKPVVGFGKMGFVGNEAYTDERK